MWLTFDRYDSEKFLGSSHPPGARCQRNLSASVVPGALDKETHVVVGVEADIGGTASIVALITE